METVVPHSYFSENVGKFFKHVKLRVNWILQVRMELYNVQILLNRDSSEIKISVNQELQVEALHYGKYISKYTLNIGGVVVFVRQTDELNFDLVINNRSMFQVLRDQPEGINLDDDQVDEREEEEPLPPSALDNNVTPLNTDLLGLDKDGSGRSAQLI